MHRLREAARLWFNGLRAINERLGLKAIYDLSATPSFLSGSGYREGTLFPWVVSDFGLVEAIESGIVKIPRVPVDDNATTPNVQFLHLWPGIKDGLPKKGRKEGVVSPDEQPGFRADRHRRPDRPDHRAGHRRDINRRLQVH